MNKRFGFVVGALGITVTTCPIMTNMVPVGRGREFATPDVKAWG